MHSYLVQNGRQEDGKTTVCSDKAIEVSRFKFFSDLDKEFVWKTKNRHFGSDAQGGAEEEGLVEVTRC